jgi:hypothetical protein
VHMSPGLDDVFRHKRTRSDRARLAAVHDLLVRVGPPPALPKRLRSPLDARRSRRSKAVPALVLAGALLLGAVSGYQLRSIRRSARSTRAVRLHPTAAAPATASGILRLGRADASGNRNLTLVVAHLPPSRQPTYYELDLTRAGRPAVSCGRFELRSARVTVVLNVPFPLDRFDGWAVVREREGADNATPLVVLRT